MKRKICFLFIVIVLGVGIYFNFNNKSVYKKNIPEIIGLKDLMVKTDKSVQTFALRDNYLLEVYTLPETSISQFKQKKNKEIMFEFYNRLYPKWQKIGWLETPFDSLYNNILRIAISPGVENKIINSELNKIKQLLIQKGAFYAFYYKIAPNRKPTELNIKASFVRLFIIDCDNNKLYVIEA